MLPMYPLLHFLRVPSLDNSVRDVLKFIMHLAWTIHRLLSHKTQPTVAEYHKYQKTGCFVVVIGNGVY